MVPEETGALERSLLLHLLEHRGAQIRFEADQWTTEFGIFRKFDRCDSGEIKQTLRSLEMSRWIYRRVQYVVGYSEPKLVFSLTPSGHRKALDLQREGFLEPAPPDLSDTPVAMNVPDPGSVPITSVEDPAGTAPPATPAPKPRRPRGKRPTGNL